MIPTPAPNANRGFRVAVGTWLELERRAEEEFSVLWKWIHLSLYLPVSGLDIEKPVEASEAHSLISILAM